MSALAFVSTRFFPELNHEALNVEMHRVICPVLVLKKLSQTLSENLQNEKKDLPT